MADFCKQCAKEMWGEEIPNDFAFLRNAYPEEVANLKEGEGFLVLCEGCGPTVVDPDGVCITPDCLEKHGVVQ